jgi:phosphohistidine phosphatase
MLYLVRHAHATDGEPDRDRPLSATGKMQVRRLAGMLRANGGFTPDEVWHSPLVRARQTARLLIGSLGLDVVAREVPGLEPGDPPGIIIPRLGSGRSIAVVGHNPHLTLLATELVAGAGCPMAFVMRKGAVLALEPARGADPGCWVASWHISPDLVE